MPLPYCSCLTPSLCVRCTPQQTGQGEQYMIVPMITPAMGQTSSRNTFPTMACVGYLA